MARVGKCPFVGVFLWCTDQIMEQTNATPHSGELTLQTRYGLAGHGMRQGRVLHGHGLGRGRHWARTPASSTMVATAESGTQDLPEDDAQQHCTLTGSIVTGIYEASTTNEEHVNTTAEMSNDQEPGGKGKQP